MTRQRFGTALIVGGLVTALIPVFAGSPAWARALGVAFGLALVLAGIILLLGGPRTREPGGGRVASRIGIVDGLGMERFECEVGESLIVEASGVRPASVHEIALVDSGEELFVDRAMSNQDGSIEPTAIWPQFGLDDLEAGTHPTVEQAQERWRGRSLRVRLSRDGTVLAEAPFRVPRTSTRPLVLSTGPDGTVRNGIDAGRDDLRVSGYGMPFAGTARVFLVPRQLKWVHGDPIAPVSLHGGRLAVADADVGGDGRFDVHFADAEELMPGAYDFVVRELPYGYEDDDLFLRDTDVVTATVTGLVVRDDFMASKFAKGGCVNLQQIAGRSIDGPPYFRYSDTFEVGEPIYAALDPAALHDAALLGKMAALYVVRHGADYKKLQHLPQLGGNSKVQTFKVQAGCINCNARLLWAGSQGTDVGGYDVVADFGKPSSQVAGWAPDANLGKVDIVDGYTVAGFRIVPDPGTATDEGVKHVGVYSYSEHDRGFGFKTVDDEFYLYDESGRKLSDAEVRAKRPPVVTKDSIRYPLRGRVFFPAGQTGATSPSQLSTGPHPVIMLIHGMGHSYTDYDYLLEHWASNGFIAVAFDAGLSWAVSRANLMFENLSALKGVFKGGMGDVAVMGHSVGGEAAVTAARLNVERKLGHRIVAVAALAPTDQYTREALTGPWATSLLVIYGSLDPEVVGGREYHPANVGGTGFAVYDRAHGRPKCMVFVHGATHNRFLDKKSLLGKSSKDDEPGAASIALGSRVLSVEAHHAVLRSYSTAFFRRHLRKEARWDGMLEGEWVPSSVGKVDGGTVELYVQYGHDDRLEIDNFDDAGKAWNTSTVGGRVTHDNTLPADPVKGHLQKIDLHSPHDTRGLIVRWDGTSDRLRFAIPQAHRNVEKAKYRALSFRIGQKVGGANAKGRAQDLYVTLTDADKPPHSRSIRVSKFAEIPAPHRRSDTDTLWNKDYSQQTKVGLTKSALRTVRIPLEAFEVEVVHLDAVNLANLGSVAFEFGVNGQGEVSIDNVEFTK